MNSVALMLVVTMAIPLFLIFWNKARTKGKMVCFFARKDKSVVLALCELRDAFVLWKSRAYDIYPDFVRVISFPTGWPSIIQEKMPCSLYDEEDALPKDWVSLDTPKEGSMRLRSALDENWIRKLVQETATEGKPGINWKKIFPFIIIFLGVAGLVVILVMKGCGTPATTLPKAGG
jgi:hypothetical protein